MKFIVSRTSLYDQRIPPCEGAVCVTPEPSEWDGQWELEIASLDELWEFIDSNGDIILSRSDPTLVAQTAPARDLEIYDGYRE